jgi:hypothetical protein
MLIAISRQSVDGDHFLRTDVDWPLKVRLHQAPNAFKALIDVFEDLRETKRAQK